MTKKILSPNSILIISFVLFFSSCNSSQKKEKENSTEVVVCQNFINDLANQKLDKLKLYFDDTVLKAADDSTINAALKSVSIKFKTDYDGEVKTRFISSEITTRENIPSTFVLLKIETATKFGFYIFYLNSKNNKIILVQQVVEVNSKR